MTDIEIFTQALELSTPWEVMEVSFKKEGSKKVLHIHVGYQKGSRFDYEGKDYSVYDHQRRTWRHIDFFQYECYLHARIPRIKTEEGKVRLVKVPWAEEGSSFSLLFERKVLELVQNGMNVSRAGRTIGIGSGQVYRIIKRMVVDALLDQEVRVVKELSIDETSSKKGHNYLTILCDREAKKVVGIGLGKLTDSVEEGLQEMEFRGGSRSDIRCVTMDMWKAYISAAQEKMNQADIVLIIDSGLPCNRQTPHSHNFLTQDGKIPKEISTIARQQVEKYKTVKFYEGLATIGTKNRLEKLKGPLKGHHSIRINEQWRIIFKWKSTDAYEVKIMDYHG